MPPLNERWFFCSFCVDRMRQAPEKTLNIWQIALLSGVRPGHYHEYPRVHATVDCSIIGKRTTPDKSLPCRAFAQDTITNTREFAQLSTVRSQKKLTIPDSSLFCRALVQDPITNTREFAQLSAVLHPQPFETSTTRVLFGYKKGAVSFVFETAPAI